MSTYSEIHAAIVTTAEGAGHLDGRAIADSVIARLAMGSPRTATDKDGDVWTSVGEDTWRYFGATGRTTVVSTAELERMYAPIEYR